MSACRKSWATVSGEPLPDEMGGAARSTSASRATSASGPPARDQLVEHVEDLAIAAPLAESRRSRPRRTELWLV